MLKTQPSALHASLTQQLNKNMADELGKRDSGHAASVDSEIPSDSINYITFNQDLSCVALALNNGFKIFNCKPNFGKCFQFKKNESIGIIEMLYCTSLLAVVSLGEELGNSPKKLKILNIKRQSTICDLIFPTTILTVKLTKQHLIVLLEVQIYIYDITNMKLLHTIETSPNSNGLCAVSLEPDSQGDFCLAYPLSPKSKAHDSLLITGINTNGGANLIQNNIQLVSNSAKRGISDVIIFNLTKLQPLSVIEAHKSTLAAMKLSNDGKLLATALDKGTIVRVFSVETGVKLYQFRRGTYPTRIYSLSFSFDDRYVIATSSSETVHIFRLGQEEALLNKHRLKKTVPRVNPERIAEEREENVFGNHDDDEEEVFEEEEDNISKKTTDSDEIHDDGDDSDADMEEDEDDDSEIVSKKQRKLSQDSSNSFSSGFSLEEISHAQVAKAVSINEVHAAPIVDQNRLSVARLIRRSSQTLGRKAAQKMGEFLPSRFSSILEPTRHFASLKINTIGKDVKSIAVMSSELTQDFVPQSYFKEAGDSSNPSSYKSSSSFKSYVLEFDKMLSLNLLHISVVTSEGFFYTYGLDPERGGDCILLNQYSLLEEK